MKSRRNKRCCISKNRYPVLTFGRKYRQNVSASLTVEAAFVFPLFLYAIMALLYLFVSLRTQFSVQRVITETARDICSYGSIIDKLYNSEEQESEILELMTDTGISPYISGVADSGIIRLLTRKRLSEHAANDNTFTKSIVGDINGISFYGSDIYTEDGCIDIICSYKLAIPIKLFGVGGIPTIQRVRYRHFTGTKVESLYVEVTEQGEDAEASEEVYVYVTETGTVYHMNRNCPSINIITKGVEFNTISDLRNEGGGKYYACEKCGKEAAEGRITYITSDGNRYHGSIQCSSLKRTVSKIPLKEAEGKRKCLRCK